MPGRAANVFVLVLPGPRLGRQNGAAVGVLEVAVGKLVPSFGVFASVALDAQVPLAEGFVTVSVDEFVLLLGRRLMLTPGIAIIGDDFGPLDELLRVLVAVLVQLDRHHAFSSARVVIAPPYRP